MAGKMVCSHCESVVPADSKFCPNCGAGFETVEPVVNQFYPPSPPSQQPEPPLPVPPPLQYSQAPVQSGFAAPAAEPRKSKKDPLYHYCGRCSGFSVYLCNGNNCDFIF